MIKITRMFNNVPVPCSCKCATFFSTNLTTIHYTMCTKYYFVVGKGCAVCWVSTHICLYPSSYKLKIMFVFSIPSSAYKGLYWGQFSKEELLSKPGIPPPWNHPHETSYILSNYKGCMGSLGSHYLHWYNGIIISTYITGSLGDICWLISTLNSAT